VWAERRQAVQLGRRDEAARAAEAAERLGVARRRADERERERAQQDAALQARLRQAVGGGAPHGHQHAPRTLATPGCRILSLRGCLLCARAAGERPRATVRAPAQAAAARQAERARAAAEAKRAAFEADEAALAAELEQRTQAERRVLAEAAERARAALEQRRRRAARPRARPRGCGASAITTACMSCRWVHSRGLWPPTLHGAWVFGRGTNVPWRGRAGVSAGRSRPQGGRRGAQAPGGRARARGGRGAGARGGRGAAARGGARRAAAHAAALCGALRGRRRRVSAPGGACPSLALRSRLASGVSCTGSA